MNKGFAYTSFAILSATLLISILFVQVYQPMDMENANAERIGEASFFLDSVFTDTDRTLSIATRRAFAGAVSEVVNSGEALKNPEENISEIMVNGTLDGSPVDSIGNASLSDWETRVSDIASDSGYSLQIEIENSSFRSTGFDIKSSFQVRATLFDPVTRASFNRTHSTSTTTSVQDLEDPMITLRSLGRYTVTVNECGFDVPAESFAASQNSSDTAYGEAVVQPVEMSSIDSKDEKVLAIENPDGYSSSELNQFEGVVASETSSDTSGITTSYAFGLGSISYIERRKNVLIDSDDVWSTGFVQMFEENCYIESEQGPDFTERLANNLAGSSGTGITTLIDIRELPPQLQKSEASAVDFVYFSDSASDNTRKLKEISDQDEYPWFRLDQDHINEWGVDELAE